MVNKAKEASRNDGPAFLRSAFGGVQKVLIEKLKLSSASITHDGTMGAVNEDHWIEVFRDYLPNRYAVNTGIVINSEGKTSDQIDIIIYDRQYTPELLNQHQHRYIPAEAVYAVFEAKPHINKMYLEYAGEKAKSVRKMKKTTVPIIHAGGKFPAKPPIEIISGIVAAKAQWTDGLGNSFKTNIEKLKGMKRLDCGIALKHGSFDFFDNAKSYTLGKKQNGLIFFLFRLLGKLQSLGTVPAIDWNAYVKLFRKS